MPELPEVETICRDLRPSIENQILTELVVLDPRWCAPVEPKDLESSLRGRRVERLFRRGKYIVLEFAGDLFLHMHLRMTGTLQLSFTGQGEEVSEQLTPINRYTRVILLFSGRSGEEIRVEFTDPRRFGTGELLYDTKAHEEFFQSRIGIEPFSEQFNSKKLWELSRLSRAPIKAFLLNQKHVVGIGNIYADEALFRARIHPLLPANRINKAQTALLYDAILKVLSDGIDARGASIDDYRVPNGEKGAFQDRFLVHRREGLPCPRCGQIISKLRVGGRGTYICSSCQEL